MTTLPTVVKKLTVLALSIGWLIPMWLGLSSIDSWVLNEIAPHLHAGDEHLNSFPYHQFAQQSLLIAGVWFSFAIVGWASYFVFFGRNSS